MDIVLDPYLHDITTLKGQEHAIKLLCRCHRGGLLWLGVPCSSWVFVGRANSGRFAWLPAGDTGRPYTRLHNHIATVAVDLARLAFFLGLVYVIEQPLTSVLYEWLPMVGLLGRTGARRVVVHMAAFGADTSKPMFGECLHGVFFFCFLAVGFPRKRWDLKSRGGV